MNTSSLWVEASLRGRTGKDSGVLLDKLKNTLLRIEINVFGPNTKAGQSVVSSVIFLPKIKKQELVD